MVAVQRAVIERLRGRHLRAPEEFALLARLHLLQHGLHVLALLGIGRARGQADLRHTHGKAGDGLRGKQAYQHHGRHRPARTEGRVDDQRHAADQQAAQAQDHPHGTVLYPPAAGDQGEAHGDNDKQVPQPEAAKLRIAAEGHGDQHEAEQEAEAIRQHIGEMEAVPDVVQHPEDKAAQEEQQQRHTHELFPQGDALAAQKPDCKRHRAEAAEHVRQALHLRRRKADQQARQHLPRRGEEARKRLRFYRLPDAVRDGPGGVFRNVQRKELGEFTRRRIGIFQAVQRGKQQHRRRADRQKRAQADARQPPEKAPHTVRPADAVAEKGQRDEDTAEKAQIIVAPQAQRQRDRVQTEPAVAQEAHRSRHQKREDRQHVQPHKIPIIPRHE